MSTLGSRQPDGSVLLWYPTDKSQDVAQTSFTVHGSVICNVTVSDREDLSSVKGRSLFAGHLSKAVSWTLKKGKLTLPDCRLRFQSMGAAMMRCSSASSVTSQLCLLQGYGLVFLDVEQLTGCQPKCPQCGSNSNVQAEGMDDGPRTCKGDGEIHTCSAPHGPTSP
jgi:hypothetical protein